MIHWPTEKKCLWGCPLQSYQATFCSYEIRKRGCNSRFCLCRKLTLNGLYLHICSYKAIKHSITFLARIAKNQSIYCALVISVLTWVGPSYTSKSVNLFPFFFYIEFQVRFIQCFFIFKNVVYCKPYHCLSSFSIINLTFSVTFISFKCLPPFSEIFP